MIHDGLEDFLRLIKERHFLVKVDTNGSFPLRLKDLIRKKLVDYIAMDVKAPLEKYREITNSKVNPDIIRKSIGSIMKSGLDYEFRTTLVKSQLSKEDIIEIGKLIKDSQLYVLQKFVPSKTLNPKFLNETTYSNEEFEHLKDILKNYVTKCLIR